jgi:late competence protein required for DNA uptake (superfamily II DNA/RNA helicase)
MLDKRLISLKELNDCKSKINKWYNKQSKILTIITNPYNTALVYLDLISSLLKENKRILYVWGETDVNKEIIEGLKENELKFKYSYINEKEGKENLIFTNFKNINKINDYYDLCIIDDISKFSTTSKEEIREYMEYLYLYSNRILILSVEKIVSMGRSIFLSDLTRNKPFVEPRIITTRVKLDEDMPYTLYDYLMWFKNNNRKVIIFIPSEEKISKLYNYYTEDLKIEDVKIIKFLKNDNLKKIDLLYKSKNRSIFLITNNIRSYVKDTNDIDIVVLFSDDIFYSYKKIIYFCAEVGKNISNDSRIGEVLLVSKEISEDMDKAKEITRGYNKEIWEKGLLNY